jgi:hypothetical protein
MNAAFERPDAEVSDRRNPNVGAGLPKAFVIANTLFQAGALKAARR